MRLLLVVTASLLAIGVAPASAAPLTGSGPHLPLPVPPVALPDIERYAPVYMTGVGTFTGTWSPPADTRWNGTFNGTGEPPGTSGARLANFDFTTLNAGFLPSGSFVGLSDVDGGTGSGEEFTMQAFDAFMNPLEIWLDEPLAVGTTNPVLTPGWEWDPVLKLYRFIGSTVPGNPTVGVLLATNQDIHHLEVERFNRAIGYNYGIGAPPQACCAPCDVAHLLSMEEPGQSGLSSTHPCFAFPVPDPPSDGCCQVLELAVAAGAPAPSSLHPCR